MGIRPEGRCGSDTAMSDTTRSAAPASADPVHSTTSRDTAIAAIDPKKPLDVEWQEKKKKGGG